MRRREFIAGLGGTAAWPLAAGAQQPTMRWSGSPTAGLPMPQRAGWPRSARGLAKPAMSRAKTWRSNTAGAEGQFDRLPALMADLVRRRVAVIAAPTALEAIAAKAATATIPIVFGVGEDRVKLGLVASLAAGRQCDWLQFFQHRVACQAAGTPA